MREALERLVSEFDQYHDGASNDHHLRLAVESAREALASEPESVEPDPLGQLWTILYGMTEQAEPDHEWLFETAKEALDLLESYTAIIQPEAKSVYLTAEQIGQPAATEDGPGEVVAWGLEWLNQETGRWYVVRPFFLQECDADEWLRDHEDSGAKHRTFKVYRHPQSDGESVKLSGSKTSADTEPGRPSLAGSPMINSDGYVHQNAGERLASGAKVMIYPTEHATDMRPITLIIHAGTEEGDDGKG